MDDLKWMSAEDLKSRREHLIREARELASADQLEGDDLKRFEQLETDIQAVKEREAEVAAQRRQIAESVAKGYVTPGVPDAPAQREAPPVTVHDVGLRAIERHKDALAPDAGDRLDGLVRHGDPQGTAGRYLAAVGDPDYATAFAKMVQDPMTGHLRFSPQEVEAVRRVGAVGAERAMSVGTGSAGGFAVPFQLDPSIMISGTGALNPLRQIARVETIEGYQWRGVSADQVTAAYGAEASEVADASPTLVQPTVLPQRGTAFVPFSIELQQDYATLMSELGRVLADARDVLDAGKFVSGSGTNEPVGLLTVGTTGALTTTQRIQTATVATFAVGDPWLLKAGLAARFINNTSVVAHPGVFDTIYRFTGGNAVEPPIIPTRDGPCFGRPKYELSTMVTTTTTTGSKIILAGDFRSGVLIADRLGFTLELVPHLFGATNRFPTGQRGALAIWRSGIGAIVPNALRYMEVK